MLSKDIKNISNNISNNIQPEIHTLNDSLESINELNRSTTNKIDKIDTKCIAIDNTINDNIIIELNDINKRINNNYV